MQLPPNLIRPKKYDPAATLGTITVRVVLVAAVMVAGVEAEEELE